MTIQHKDGRIEFQFYRPGVQRVWLMGDFNDWQPEQTAMEPDPMGSGWWSTCCDLPAGTYEFLYQADGALYPDYAAFGLSCAGGDWKSVLHVFPASRASEEEAELPVTVSGADIECPAVQVAPVPAAQSVEMAAA